MTAGKPPVVLFFRMPCEIYSVQAMANQAGRAFSFRIARDQATLNGAGEPHTTYSYSNEIAVTQTVGERWEAANRKTVSDLGYDHHVACGNGFWIWCWDTGGFMTAATIYNVSIDVRLTGAPPAGLGL